MKSVYVKLNYTGYIYQLHVPLFFSFSHASHGKPKSDVSKETKLQSCPTSQVNFTCQNIQNGDNGVTKTCTGMYSMYNIHQYFWY